VSSADAPGAALSIAQATAAIAAGALTARALADAQLARVAATDAAIGAWATLDPAHVRAEADRCDAASPRGTLHGIGIGVKDIVATVALPTGCGSPAFAGQPVTRDAECVARLRAAGGYVFGKTVTTEVAFMHPGKTRNPWNPAHTPGGSSSGSAAAVAAGHVAAAIGTQTNGSVIRPAAYCGVVGYKPTVGAIAYDGVHLFSHTLDTIGTFARSVADAARVAAALALRPAELAPTRSAASPRLAFLRAFPWVTPSPAMARALDAAVARLEAGGARVQRVTLPPGWHDATHVLRTIMLAEAARHLAPLRARSAPQLSATLLAALDEGAAIDQTRYVAALARRAAMIGELPALLDGADAIASPAAPAAAPRGLDTTGDPSCCTLWSLLGAPAIALPVALDADGLPLGLQLAGRPGDDARLLGVAAWSEAQLPFAAWTGRRAD